MTFSIGPVAAKEYNFLASSEGDYSCWSYYQCLENKQNKKFVQLFRNKYGQDRLISDSMESAYVGIHLWAQAMLAAETSDPKIIKEAIKGQAYEAPAGVVYVEPENNHFWKIVRVGQKRGNGDVNILWDSVKPVKPRSYPFFEVSQ